MINYQKIRDTANNLAVQKANCSNVELLSIDEINHLQNYLNQIKERKMQKPTLKFNTTNTYYNPYELSKQTQTGQLYNNYHTEYAYDDSLDKIGLTKKAYDERFPGEVRNINVESSLLQNATTRLPGSRSVTSKEVNRFTHLPFDPQDPKHIVWGDMPRGGFPTRASRLEL